MVSGEGELRGERLYPSTQGAASAEHGRRLCPSPEECILHAEKVKFGAYFCIFLSFQHEIIVDSKLPGDVAQALGAGRWTPVSGRLL